jgi:hypothetical protein
MSDMKFAFNAASYGIDEDRDGRLVASGERTMDVRLDEGLDGVSFGDGDRPALCRGVKPANGLMVFRREADMTRNGKREWVFEPSLCPF